MRYFVFISDQKSSCFFFVPSTPAKWNSFCNHRNRKVVGGKHNVLVHYVDVSAPNPSGVVLWIPFRWDILYSFLIKNHHIVFVPSTAAKWISFHNHKDRKVVGGKDNVLILYVTAIASNPSSVVLCNPFKWDILCSYLIKNHLVIFVHATTANRIPFCNRRNRKVVGGKHNILIHYLDVSAPDSSGYVLCNPFKWDILCSYLLKNVAQQRNESQNIPISASRCLLHWNTNQPFPYHLC